MPAALSPFEALVAASLVAEVEPGWLAGPVKELAEASGDSRYRASRVKGRVREGFRQLVAEASRRGAPSGADPAVAELERKVALQEELLEIQRGLIDEARLFSRANQDALVAAAGRLKDAHGLPEAEFSNRLGVATRTFRYWKRRADQLPAPTTPPPPPPVPPDKGQDPPPPPPLPPLPNPRPTPSRGAGRFDLEHTLPGVQAMGDTTQVEVLGVPMKLVASQDPGARDEHLLESFSCEPVENAEVIAEVLRTALRDLPGAQFVPDQGTPYMAVATRELCDELEVEHSPTREGTPTEKATLERAFGVVKSALRPLLELTNRFADAFPSLAVPALARALGLLLFGTFLRVYRAASRERPGRGPTPSREVVAALVEEQRERVRAEERSKRLYLEGVWGDYSIGGSKAAFVAQFRRYHLEDVKAADAAFRNLYCCCRIRAPRRYFAAILRRVAAAGRGRRTAARHQVLREAEEAKTRTAVEERRKLLEREPQERILQGFRFLASQLDPATGKLRFGGAGPGRVDLQRGLEALAKQPGLARDHAEVAWDRWVAGSELEEPALRSLRALYDKLLQTALPPPTSPAS